MNAETFNSHLAAIDAGNASHDAIFERVAAIRQLARSVADEYEPRLDVVSVDIHEDFDHTIFGHTSHHPHRISFDGTKQIISLTLREYFRGETDYEPINIPYAWVTMTDAELTTLFRSMLDARLKQATDRQAADNAAFAQQERETYEALKARFEP